MAPPSERHYQARRPRPIIVETVNPGYASSYTVANDADKEVPQRPQSAPANKSGPTGALAESRKRAHTAEPMRSSKRLRGTPADGERAVIDLKREEVAEMEPSTDGLHHAAEKESKPKRDFKRTVSGGSSTTQEEDDVQTPGSTQSTLPTPNDPLSPQLKRVPLPAADSEGEVPAARTTSFPRQQPVNKGPISTLPAHSNVVPPAVPINGYPPLRIVFRNHCFYREKADLPNAEWQSDYFLQRCIDDAFQQQFEQELQSQGYINIPPDLFPALNDGEILRLHTFIIDFFERYSMPGQFLPTVPDFIDPTKRTLDTARLVWWEKLSSYFGILDYFSRIFAPNVANWHILYHALPTFALMREFGEMLDRWGLERGAENMHQELARRVAYVQGTGKVDVALYDRLCRLTGEQLRDESRKFDGKEEDWDECGICVVKPAFKGDKFLAQP